MPKHIEKSLYTASVTSTGGGRADGHSKSADGQLDLTLNKPKEMGGSGEGTNPEQLFAAGYSACFLGALYFVAGQNDVTLPDDVSVTADVGIGKRTDGGGFAITAALNVSAPGIDEGTLKDLVDKAHIVCPYSHAIKNTIDVDLSVS